MKIKQPLKRYSQYGLLPLLFVSAIGTAYADDERIYVAPMFSYAIQDHDRYAHDGNGGVLAIGFPFATYFAAELRGSYLKYEDTHDPGTAPALTCLLTPNNPNCPFSHSNNVPAGGLGLNAFLTSDGWRPYLHADAQYGEFFQYNAGLGLDVPLNDYVAIRAEALYHVQQYDKGNSDTTFHEALFNIGLKIPFGAKEVPVPPPEPAPVEVVPVAPPPPPPPQCSDGIDNDGDGAIDYPADKGCTDANDNDEYNPICKAPAPGEKVNLEGCGVGDTIVLQGVTFEFDKARLTPNAKVILDGVAEALVARPDIKVELGGHTDSKGSDAYNLRLSDKRAKSVKDYLVTRGVESGRMTSKGYGETMPVAGNETDEGRELNRRVELRITESIGAATVAPTQRTAENAAPLPEADLTSVTPPPAPPADAVPQSLGTP